MLHRSVVELLENVSTFLTWIIGIMITFMLMTEIYRHFGLKAVLGSWGFLFANMPN